MRLLLLRVVRAVISIDYDWLLVLAHFGARSVQLDGLSGRLLADWVGAARAHVPRQRNRLDLLRVGVPMERPDLQMISQNILIVPRLIQNGLGDLDGADSSCGTMHRMKAFSTVLVNPHARFAGRLAISYAQLPMSIFTYAQVLLLVLEAATVCQLIVPIVAELLGLVSGEMADLVAVA